MALAYVLLALGAALLFNAPPVHATLQPRVLQPGGIVGEWTSLVLDAAGNPVVSYYDRTRGDLKIFHCQDAQCSGIREHISTPDADGDVGRYSSLALDQLGYPVVSYYDASNGSLKLLHCADSLCQGTSPSIETVDSAGDVGHHSSLALDQAGNAVIAYYDVTNGDLKVLRCTNASCSSEVSIEAPDTAGNVGAYASLELDADSHPVVAYCIVGDFSCSGVRIMHCNDTFFAGGDETITTFDTEGRAGFPSLALDGSGHPVVSYFEGLVWGSLKILHCNDESCQGGDDSLTSVDRAGFLGGYTSLALDELGNPVVAYYDGQIGAKLLRCNDPNCAGDDETIERLASGGEYASLTLDGHGYPVVAHYTGDYVQLIHCNDVACTGGDESLVGLDGMAMGLRSSLQLDGAGLPVIAYTDGSLQDLLLLRCADSRCESEPYDIHRIDAASAMSFISLQLDSGGRPVVSYFRDTLKIAHCADDVCASGATISAPDSSAVTGGWSSLALDAAGNPIVAYRGVPGRLRVLHCNDPACIGGDESIVDIDGAANAFGPSLKLDESGHPVVAFLDEESLRLLRCNDPDCAGEGNVITTPDESADGFPSLALDESGHPVIAYGETVVINASQHRRLKVLRCDDPACAGGDDVAQVVQTGESAGIYNDVELGEAGLPVIASAASRATLTVCNDPACASGGEVLVLGNTTSEAPSLALDSSSVPVIAYYTPNDASLNLLRCQTRTCADDSDSDGCTDQRELSASPRHGGERDPKNPWDFFDTTGDRRIRVADVLRVVRQYRVDAGSPSYDPVTDRTFIGPDPWDLGPPDGLQRISDILFVIAQFGHDCV